MVLWRPIGRLCCTWQGRIWLKNKCLAVFGSMPSPMLCIWWTQFRVNSKITLPPLSFWFMGLAMMSTHWYLFSLCAIFITRRMVISPAWNIKCTQWTVLSLGGRQHPMRSSSTTYKTIHITNLTLIALIPTGFLAWCILIWNMMVASFASTMWWQFKLWEEIFSWNPCWVCWPGH